MGGEARSKGQGARHEGQDTRGKRAMFNNHPSVLRMSPVGHTERAAWGSGKAACARASGRNVQRWLDVLVHSPRFSAREQRFNSKNIHVECRRSTCHCQWSEQTALLADVLTSAAFR